MTLSPAITFAPANQLQPGELARVLGGNDASFGRCGPRDGWRWLGDVRTPQCAAHDAAVRGNLAAGQHPVEAHVRALPHLPAAIGSYIWKRLGG